jgi:very-short-patch-repair endonuclease
LIHRSIPPRHRRFARDMRADATKAENLLWQALRNRQLEGLKFKRQVPLDGYILDFVCFEARLIVEVDGGQHSESTSDLERDQHFAAQGFRTLRFWNDEAERNIAPPAPPPAARSARGRASRRHSRARRFSQKAIEAGSPPCSPQMPSLMSGRVSRAALAAIFTSSPTPSWSSETNGILLEDALRDIGPRKEAASSRRDAERRLRQVVGAEGEETRRGLAISPARSAARGSSIMVPT